jgi:hypothetical protein
MMSRAFQNYRFNTITAVSLLETFIPSQVAAMNLDDLAAERKRLGINKSSPDNKKEACWRKRSRLTDSSKELRTWREKLIPRYVTL